MSNRIVLRVASIALLVLSLPVLAQSTPDVLDRFTLGLGSFVASTTTIVTVDGALTGTEIDFEENLGLDDDSNLFRLDFDWRFADRHQIGVGYYTLDRTESRQITGEIIFDDVVFPVDTIVESNMDIEFFDVSYTYWAYRTNDKAFGIRGGLVAMSVSAGLKNVPQQGESPLELAGKTSTTLPVPGIGAAYRQMFGRSWLLDTKVLFLPEVSYSDYEGDTLNASAAMEYRFLDHYAVGAAYSFFGFRLAVDRPNLDGTFSYKIRGANLYVRLFW
jgi:hypothetical protein